MHEINILANLCHDIDFEDFSGIWAAVQQQQGHSEKILHNGANNWTMQKCQHRKTTPPRQTQSSTHTATAANQLALFMQSVRWTLGLLIMTMTKNNKQTMTILLLTSTQQWLGGWIYKTNMNTTMQEINRWQRWVLRHNGVEFPQQEIDSQEERKRKQQQKQTLQWRV